jgi:hypothetical protein
MKKIVAFLCLALLLVPCASFQITTSQASSNPDDLPASFTWRDVNGTDYVTPIKDQSPAPTCEAFGLCAALETEMQYKLREIYTPDLSENHLYFYAGGTIEKGYVNIVDAANYLMQNGVPDEGCYPDPHRAFDYTFHSLPGWENRTVKIAEWGWVNHSNITAMKQALIEHGPLVICIHFWNDFFVYLGGIYKHHDGQTAGGHVVAIIGYNDKQNCWIVKNSWGTKWGERGYFRMAYDADMIAEWYGNGTGVMYLDGLYGNLKPDAPKVHIDTPVYYHTYLFGLGFSTLLKKLPYQAAAARIVGPLTVKVHTENAVKVEFFLDNASQYIDTEAPFTWKLQATKGIHTLEAKATNSDNVSSIDIEDIYVFT